MSSRIGSPYCPSLDRESVLSLIHLMIGLSFSVLSLLVGSSYCDLTNPIQSNPFSSSIGSPCTVPPAGSSYCPSCVLIHDVGLSFNVLSLFIASPYCDLTSPICSSYRESVLFLSCKGSSYCPSYPQPIEPIWLISAPHFRLRLGVIAVPPAGLIHSFQVIGSHIIFSSL